MYVTYIYMCMYMYFLLQLCGGAILGLGVWMIVSEGGAAFMEILHDASCEDCSKAIEYLKVSQTGLT